MHVLHHWYNTLHLPDNVLQVFGGPRMSQARRRCTYDMFLVLQLDSEIELYCSCVCGLLKYVDICRYMTVLIMWIFSSK